MCRLLGATDAAVVFVSVGLPLGMLQACSGNYRSGDGGVDGADGGIEGSVDGSNGDVSLVDASSDQDAGTCSTMAAPPLPNYSNASKVGLRFHVAKAATLVQFVFHNYGKLDTISLADASCNVLATVATPANTQSFTANVNWPLVANQTYLLINAQADNGWWGPASYPWTSGGVVVENYANCSGANFSSGYWFNFSDLKTCE